MDGLPRPTARLLPQQMPRLQIRLIFVPRFFRSELQRHALLVARRRKGEDAPQVRLHQVHREGIRHPSLVRFPPGPTMLQVNVRSRMKVVDFTCNRASRPLCSMPTSYSVESPCGFSPASPICRTRAMKQRSAHAPCSLHVANPPPLAPLFPFLLRFPHPALVSFSSPRPDVATAQRLRQHALTHLH